MLPTIDWQDGAVVMVDQRKLPGQELYIRCRTAQEVARAIRTMVIRGAPAIGVAAAMGIALGMRNSSAKGTRQFAVDFQKICDMMASTRPTAVNLFWAIDRMKGVFAEAAQAGQSTEEIADRLERESRAIHDEDVAACRAMGRFGAAVVPDGARVLTHCNAGALATAGYGSALGVIRAAVEQGKRIAVIADETRPFLQGARLTAWELVREGINTTVITESMAGPLMRAGDIDIVVVGADRIAANGDTANKIGTYTVAVLAHEHKVPFYVAAPLSTIDLATPDGDQHPDRGARSARGQPPGVGPPDPGGRAHQEPGVRCDAQPLHHRIHHRARHLQAAVHRVAEARVRGGCGHAVSRPILAIETSCDETAAAVIGRTADPGRPWTILSSIVASQTEIHREWGGVVPELASRQHVRDICGVVEAALDQAGVSAADLSGDCGDAGTGSGRLAAGRAWRSRSRSHGRAACRSCPCITWPATSNRSCSPTASCRCRLRCWSCPGGHTSLYFIPEAGRYQLVGRTRDDAAGEAYDKVAKLLGLGYPGGPVIDRLAREGNEHAYDFPVARLTHADRNAPQTTAPAGLLPADVARRVDFSFSGLKTAVLRLVRELHGHARARQGGRCRRARRGAHARSRWPTSRPAFSASS